MQVKDAYFFAIAVNIDSLSDKEILNSKKIVQDFCDWIETNALCIADIYNVTNNIFNKYFKHLDATYSIQKRNDIFRVFYRLTNILKDNGMVLKDPLKDLSVIKIQKKRNYYLTAERQSLFFKYLQENDPVLLTFILFMAHGFLRPIEVCRIKMSDIDLKNSSVTIRSGNTNETIVLPSELMNNVKEIKRHSDSESFLYTPFGIGQIWNVKEVSRLNSINQRYRAVAEVYFKHSEEYGLYSFRHIFVERRYKFLKMKFDEDIALENMLTFTRHNNKSVLKNYLERTIN